MIPTAQLCYTAHERYSSTREEPVGAVSECRRTTREGFGKQNEILVPFRHGKPSNRKRRLASQAVSQRRSGCRCLTGHTPALPKPEGVPPLASRCPRYLRKSSPEGGGSPPLSTSRTETRHADSQTSAATTEAFAMLLPPSIAGAGAATLRRRLGALGGAAPPGHPASLRSGGRGGPAAAPPQPDTCRTPLATHRDRLRELDGSLVAAGPPRTSRVFCPHVGLDR